VTHNGDALAFDGKRFPSLHHHEQLASVLRVFYMTREDPTLFGVPPVFVSLLQNGRPQVAHRRLWSKTNTFAIKIQVSGRAYYAIPEGA
jgi:hypothetical protein